MQWYWIPPKHRVGLSMRPERVGRAEVTRSLLTRFQAPEVYELMEAAESGEGPSVLASTFAAFRVARDEEPCCARCAAKLAQHEVDHGYCPGCTVYHAAVEDGGEVLAVANHQDVAWDQAKDRVWSEYVSGERRADEDTELARRAAWREDLDHVYIMQIVVGVDVARAVAEGDEPLSAVEALEEPGGFVELRWIG